MNCPRCGSQKTSRSVRKEKKTVKKVVDGETVEDRTEEKVVVHEWCDDCGWHGQHEK